MLDSGSSPTFSPLTSAVRAGPRTPSAFRYGFGSSAVTGTDRGVKARVSR